MSGLIGKKVGPYRISRVIGQGGMGKVYEAVHEQIERRVAIKVLHAEFTHEQNLTQRFRTEARAANQIAHPGIVSIYDFGALSDGSPYLVMEYLDGESLAARMIHQGPLPIGDTLRLGLQLMEPLALVHKKGIVHRDIKPSNVILVPDAAVSGGERAKLLDFGIAKLALAHLDSKQTEVQTQDGMLLGTPAYMSPEQCRGASEVDDRADVYSLGVVLYQMISGRLPFNGGPLELLTRHLAEPPPLITQFRPDTPPALSALVHSMLAKDPRARPSMSSCAAAISRIKAEPVTPDAGTVILGVMDRLGTVFAGWSGPANPKPVEHATLLRCLPPSLAGAAPEIHGFLFSLFTGYAHTAQGVLHLSGRRGGRRFGAEDYDCFAIFIGEEHSSSHALGEQTFARFASPMEERLRQLDRDLRKLILVVTDTLELGRGVHAKILDYQTEFNATVLPCYIGEIRKARGERARALIARKLADLHARADPFAGAGALVDPLRFIGMSGARNDLLRSLRREAFIALYGPPAAGKTALLNRIEYELPERRFLSIPCRGESSPAAVAAAIASRLETGLTTSGMPTEVGPTPAPPPLAEGISRMQRALLQARASQPLVLRLDDADRLIDSLDSAATAETRAAALSLFCALAGLAQPGALCVVVIAVHAFLLGERQLGGHDNPLIARVHCQRMSYLRRSEIHEVIDRLSGETRVRFSASAVHSIYRLSAGHVGLVRALCSRLLEQRAEQEQTPSNRDVRAAEVLDVAQELAGFRHTFGDTLLLALTPAEREVLACVAHHRPPLQRMLLGRLRNRFPSAVAASALDRLHKLRLVRRIRGRLQVSIPLLQDWLVSTAEGGGAEGNRFGLIFAGAVLSGVMLLGHWAAVTPSPFHELRPILSSGLRIAALIPFLIAVLWTFREEIGALGLPRPSPAPHDAERPTEGAIGPSHPPMEDAHLQHAPAPLPPQPAVTRPVTVSSKQVQKALEKLDPILPITIIENPPSRQPVRIFLSYAKEDEESREDLERFLTVPIRQGVLTLWHEHCVEPGRAWSQEIAAKLAEADIILLLVSQYYLSSDVLWDAQLEPALQRHKAGSAVVVPVLLSESDWRNTPLKDIQPLPKNGEPISSRPNQDKVWTDVKEGIWGLAKRLHTQRAATQ